MLNKIILVIALLVGSVLAAWGASSSLSNLQSGGPITNTDLFYDVQAVGVGGVKVTGSQFLSYVFGNVSGGCTANGSGVFSCGGITAGTNITTSPNGIVSIIVNAVPTTPELGVQVNHQGVFTADSGFTYLNGIATHTLGTVTTSNSRAENIIGTWNASAVAFDAPFFMNITTSAFAVGSKLMDLQASGVSVYSITASGALASAALQSGGAQCLHASAGGLVSGTGSDCSGGGGTPGGSNTQVQFNNNSAFGGDAGFTYTTPASVLITSGIIATTVKSLNISQAWNSSGVSFDAPLFVAATGTFAMPSLLIDLQLQGTTIFAAGIKGGGGPGSDNAIWMGSAPTTSNWILGAVGASTNINAAGQINLEVAGSNKFVAGGSTNAAQVAVTFGPTADVGINRDATIGVASISDFGSGATPTGLRIYNTTDQAINNIAPTNFERGIADWTTSTNVFTLGTQAHGTGVGRNVAIIASNTIAQTISQTATTFAAALNAPAIAQLGATTTGYACWTTGTGAISEDSTACLASLRRLKKDIVPLTDTTAELMALKPSQFQWKDPVDTNQRGPQLGFVAEDTHDVDSRLASYTGDGSLHGWRQDAMIAALVRGFQEQQAIIQRQQAEIEELKQGRLP